MKMNPVTTIEYQTSTPTEADRIALTNMFKAIAEYGRKVRLRKLAECEKAGLEKPVKPELNIKRHLPHREQKHKWKDGAE
jgi:hypothetical protein